MHVYIKRERVREIGIPGGTDNRWRERMYKEFCEFAVKVTKNLEKYKFWIKCFCVVFWEVILSWTVHEATQTNEDSK
jgi:hypothetical protein